MTKGKIVDVYQFLAGARMSKLTDDEKVLVITLLRKMKPVAMEIQAAVSDASEKAKKEYPDDIAAAKRLVNKSVVSLLQEEVQGFSAKVLNEDVFQRLCFSNDWTFQQMELLGFELLVD